MKSTEDYLDSLLAGAIRNNRNLNESFDESDKNDSAEDSFSRENEGKHKYSVRSEESRSSESALDELLKNAMLPPKTQRDYLREEAEAEAEAEKTIIYEENVEPEEESPLLNLDEEMDEKIPEEISLEVPDQEIIQNDDETETSSEALFGDSSKMMSLDEIAAIIASAGTDLEDSSTDIKGYEEPLEDIDSLADSFGDIDLTDIPEENLSDMIGDNFSEMIKESFSDMSDENISDMSEENFSDISDEGISELIEEPVAAMTEELMIDSLADDLVIGDLDTASHTEEYAGIDGDMTLGELMPDLFGSPEEDEDSADSMMSAGDVLMQGGLSSASDEEASDIDVEKADAISDDPNKQLNQDDIAALINQLHQDDAEEEATPASETASLDDPNKMMSQDDVAALLANMSLDEDDNKEIEAMEIADAFEKVDEDESGEDESGEDESAEDLSEEKPVEEENIDIDAKTNDLMALLLDDDSDKSDASNDDEGFDNINDQLNGLEDMSEDDIEAMLKAAEDTEGGSSSVSDGDVVDIVEAIGGDEDTKEVASLLKSVDDNEIVDESFLDKLDKAEADGENQDPDAENSDGKKKKKKKGLLSKLFGKKDADDEAEASEGTGANPEAAEGRSETGDGEQAPAADKSEKKEKKPGFFTKLLNLLTEEVEEEISVPEAGSNLISDENKAILEELDAEDGGKKKKKGKKGKGKDEGEKKPKKEKKPKAPKPKKEKLLEPKDKTKQIPKKYIMASVLVAASLLAILILITSYMPKLMTMQSARDAYYSKDYKTAFYTLYGKDLNESDELIYNKAKTIILVERKLESFENYSMLGMRLEALDALLSGLQRYEDLKDEATEYNVIDEITDIRIQILNALSSNFGISESEAMSILELDELNYYRMINSIVNGTPYISAEDEVNMMYGITTDAPVSYDGSSTGYDSNEFPDLLPEEADYLNGNYEDTDVPEESGLQFLNPEDAEGFNTQHGAVEEADPIDPEIIIESNQF